MAHPSGASGGSGVKGAGASDRATPSRRPNVLLISLDTLRADHLGCYGYDRPTSPNIDRFAADSVLFTNARSQSTWTLPSHMSLFTSMLPSHNGVDNLNKVLAPEIPTLPELLKEEGYRTAALVNNGQMRAHWGFNRGFDTWREFQVDTPEGDCENITGQAVDWLGNHGEGDDPFFLFLHYYDAHDPYDAPEPHRHDFHVELTGPQARALCHQHRFPGQDVADPELVQQLIDAYDAEIARLDASLGQLFAAVPPNTMVVIFSDHGEAFEEHGWMLHGATVYEEEIHVPLIVHLPTRARRPAEEESASGGRTHQTRRGKPAMAHAGQVAPTVIDASVMLMDVAPTILSACGAHVPADFQGLDLSPLWRGESFPQRLIPSEAKAVLEGRLSLSVVLYPLKGVYSLFDGRFELYRLPDEQQDLAQSDPEAGAALFGPLRGWASQEQYWMLHAAGRGDYEATIELSEGAFDLFIPVGHEPGRDGLEVARDGRRIRWHVYPGQSERPKALFLRPVQPEAQLTVDLKINGQRQTQRVFLGADHRHPEQLPAQVGPTIAPRSPVIEQPFEPEQAGFYLFHHRAATATAQPGPRGQVQPLDDQTLEQLRSLGYVQ